MPPRARWPRSAPARASADTRLVNAVLAVIDRIGELVQALETGEALASEDDEQLIAALSSRGRAGRAGARAGRRAGARSEEGAALASASRSTCSTG